MRNELMQDPESAEQQRLEADWYGYAVVASVAGVAGWGTRSGRVPDGQETRNRSGFRGICRSFSG